MDNSSTSSSCDDSDYKVEILKEPDPTMIPFHFLKKGESSKEGVLITDETFKFTKNNSSQDGKTWWYTCAHKNSHGCAARATIKRQEFTGEDDELYVKNFLVEISTPEVR